MKEKWYSIREAAAYLEIGEPTLYRWMRENKITFRKVGDSTRFLQADLDAVIEVHPAAKQAEAAHRRCPYCGSEDLLPGRLRSTGLLYFQLEKTKFWTLRDSSIPTQGRVCARCGGVVLTADLAKVEKLRRQMPETEGDGSDPCR